MKIRYDAEVDALYIELRTLEPGTAECRELTPDITADLPGWKSSMPPKCSAKTRTKWCWN